MPDAEIEDWKHELAREPNDYLAQAVDGVTMAHRRWLQLDNERHQLRMKFNAFFRTTTSCSARSAASAAFPHDRRKRASAGGAASP